MRDGIDSTRRAQALRQRHGEIDVVDDGPRQNRVIRARCLASIRRLAEDGRHLTPRVGSGDGNVLQPGAHRDGLAQARGTATPERYDTIRSHLAGVREGLVGDVGGGVHRGVGVEAGGFDAAILQYRLEGFDLVGLLRCRQEQRFRLVQPLDFVGELLDAAAAEDDAGGVGVVLE